MQRCKTAGISIPVELMTKIDQERGDVTRSRYIVRLMQRGMKYRKEDAGYRIMAEHSNTCTLTGEEMNSYD